ncbi:MAG: copper amine oxidase N-terminal domain-containing protein [Peptococcaceae bacterium]|nr:copper amine oxidase N-terminal domain-containing protein [Peptococcaceae bacterium]
MKKKLTALLALAMMLLTLLPSGAFAASADDYDIKITVISFNSNTTAPNDNVIVNISGSDARKGYRVNAILDGVSEPLLSGTLTSNGDDTFYIPKSKIPNIEDAFANNTLTVNVYNAAGSKVLKSASFDQKTEANAPEKVVFYLDDGNGTTNRAFSAKFDAKYVPGDNDQIRLTALDANGNRVGSVNYTTITTGKLGKVGDDEMRALNNKITANFNSRAEKVQVSFWSDGTEMTEFRQTFSLASQYGTYKALELDFDKDTVAPGESVEGTLYYVNTDNKRYDITDKATRYIYGGSENLLEKDDNKPAFTVKSSAAGGDQITVTAYYGSYVAKKTLTIVNPAEASALGMSATSGKAGENISVTFTLLDENGKTTTLDFQPTKVSARWTDLSDESANITFTAGALTNLDDNGTMLAAIKSDRATSGKLELTFTDNAGHSYQAVSDTFRFTDPNASESHKVTMNIGSTQMSVDGTTKTMDVAPLVYQNRTFVPLRALTEAFGVEPKWNGADSTITIVDGDTTIVMTAGSKSYTINGQTKTMDAAPYIVAGANRTMVPVRFIGEALGYKVQAIYRADGTTSGVEFSN